MRHIEIEHREQGRGYLLYIEGVQETILMDADSLLYLSTWGIQHKAELEQEAKEIHNEKARRLLDEQ